MCYNVKDFCTGILQVGTSKNDLAEFVPFSDPEVKRQQRLEVFESMVNFKRKLLEVVYFGPPLLLH